MKSGIKKIIFIGLLLFSFIDCYSQEQLKKVKFELYFDKSKSFSGCSLIVLNSDPAIGAQTDSSGKAELEIQNWNSIIQLYFLGQNIEFAVKENVDLIRINLKKRKIIYYKGNKVFKRERINI